MELNYVKLALSVAVLFTAFSCEGPLAPLDDQSSIPSPKVIVEDDYLAFRSFEDFDQYISTYVSLTQQDLIGHEEELGFRSMRSFFYQALESELDFQKSIAETGNETAQKHSQFVLDNQYRLKFGDHDNILLNTSWYDASVALNADGFVRIGSVLHQYLEDRVKVIHISALRGGTRQELFADDNPGEYPSGLTVAMVEKFQPGLSERTSFNGSCSDITPAGYTMRGSVTYNNTPRFVFEYDSSCGCYRSRIQSYLAVCNASMSVRGITFSKFAVKTISGTYTRSGHSTQSFNFVEASFNDMNRTLFSFVHFVFTGDASPVDLSNLWVEFDADSNTECLVLFF